MSLVIQIIVAVFGAFLSVVLTKFLIQNGRAILSEGKATRELIKELGEKMDEGFKLIARLIVEENERTRKEILEALKK